MASGYIILLSIASLLLFLIVVSNISLLNPGPTKDQHLNCYFHNVQGFVTLNSVGKPYPDLNITKLLEFQAYIFQNTPDIVILNETWLKSCINDKEIIPGDTYKIFRKDRSCLSHPPDPQNSNKFKRNGGGVLIAIKNSLNICPKEIKTTCKAEILSIEITLPNKKKISISTHYRVGTLGVTSFNEVKQHLHNIFRSKKYKNNFIVGDMNLESVNWHTNSSNNNLQSSYVSLFADIGVSQLIFEPTHRSGNILDILLTDTPDLMDNIAVHPHGCFTYSDHSPLTFGIRTFIKRQIARKRCIYNFKKADWKSLNIDLSRVDWHFILDNSEPDIGWDIFKNKFVSLCDKHIPKIRIKESFQPPWFYSDVFRLNKKKEHFRKLFKETENTLLHDNQHGFLPNKSCTTQLLPFSHHISLCLNSGGLVDVVYFDFAKAFDTVNHDIILRKLKYQFKIDGLMLKSIKNFLKGRKQQVLVNRKLSTPSNVKSGVPQGSILGPLLFVLFINDMQTVVSEHTNIALYADDTKILRHIKSPTDHDILQSDINALSTWAELNKMKFHPDKCKILSINNFNKNLFQELPFYYYPYQLQTTILDYALEEKDLGILTTPNFSFKTHQNYILNKAITQFNLLRRTCHFVNNSSKRLTLYLTLIRSLFNHASQTWRPNGSAIEPFENFQKRCIKWIFKESYMSYSESEYYGKLKSLKILPLEYYFLNSDLIIFHKIIHKSIPVLLPRELVKNNPRTRLNRNTNLNCQLHESISTPKQVLSNSFFLRSVSHWNRLPNEIKELSDINEFKLALEKYLWTRMSLHLDTVNESDREPD